MCFVDLETSFDRIPRKILEWAMRKKEIPEVLLRSLMSLYEGARTRIRVDSELSEEFEVKAGIYQGSVLSHFLLTLVVDVIGKEHVLSELLYTDDIVLTSETVEQLSNKSIICRGF